MDVQARVAAHACGTLTHMPPEAVMEGIVATGTDVYSLGVLLWQMYTSSRPWSGLTQSQIVARVGG